MGNIKLNGLQHFPVKTESKNTTKNVMLIFTTWPKLKLHIRLKTRLLTQILTLLQEKLFGKSL